MKDFIDKITSQSVDENEAFRSLLVSSMVEVLQHYMQEEANIEEKLLAIAKIIKISAKENLSMTDEFWSLVEGVKSEVLASSFLYPVFAGMYQHSRHRLITSWAKDIMSRWASNQKVGLIVVDSSVASNDIDWIFEGNEGRGLGYLFRSHRILQKLLKRLPSEIPSGELYPICVSLLEHRDIFPREIVGVIKLRYNDLCVRQCSRILDQYLERVIEERPSDDKFSECVEIALKISINYARSLAQKYFDVVGLSTYHPKLLSWYLSYSESPKAVRRYISQHLISTSYYNVLERGLGLKRLSENMFKQRSVKLFASVNNELLILPEFLSHYRNLGVEEFFIVDNQSSDGSGEYLLSQEDVHVFWTDDSYKASSFNAVWINELISEYSSSSEYIIKVDVDEFMHIDFETLRLLFDDIKKEGAEGAAGFMLDVYPSHFSDLDDLSVSEYINNGNKYFDPVEVLFPMLQAPYVRFGGGLRSRLNKKIVTNLTKTPVVLGGGEVNYLNSNHYTTPIQIYSKPVPLVHYKIVPGFQSKVKLQMDRGEHYGGGRREKGMLRMGLKRDSLIVKLSKKFEADMSSDDFFDQQASKEFLKIIERAK